VKLTNKFRAPDAIVRAIENDSYTKDGADFSVTELIKPPQVRRLWQKHGPDGLDEISIDVREEIWKLLGSGVHAVLESQSGDEGTKEQRFHAEHDGVTISGAIDLIDDSGLVTDYKVTSTFTVQQGVKEDWERQLNLYAWLLRQNNITARALNIVAICRDWMRSRAEKPEYPQSPVVVIRVPLWSDRRQDDYLATRIRVHTQEATLPCTPEERWARGAYQVLGGKGRPKTFNTMREATTFINGKKEGSYRIVEGDATYVRCESWCEVAEFCPQWTQSKGGQRGNV